MNIAMRRIRRTPGVDKSLFRIGETSTHLFPSPLAPPRPATLRSRDSFNVIGERSCAHSPPVQRILLELDVSKVFQIAEHRVVDEFNLVVVEIELLQIGEPLEHRVVDYFDVVERHVQGSQVLRVTEPLVGHYLQVVAPQVEVLQSRQSYERVRIDRLYLRSVQVQGDQGRAEFRKLVPANKPGYKISVIIDCDIPINSHFLPLGNIHWNFSRSVVSNVN